ncbi:hypothetical protein PG995_013095 [Apiospora arundinis]
MSSAPADSSPSPADEPVPEEECLFHQKIVTVKNPIEVLMDETLAEDDPRRLVLGLPEHNDLARYRVPTVYLKNATNAEAALLPIKPEFVDDEPAEDAFQESMMACMLNLSPFLNLLDRETCKHVILNSLAVSDWESFHDLRLLFWDEDVRNPRYYSATGRITRWGNSPARRPGARGLVRRGRTCRDQTFKRPPRRQPFDLRRSNA